MVERTGIARSAFTSIAALCLVSGALAGCGGSTPAKVTTERAHPSPAQSNADVGGAQAQIVPAPSTSAGKPTQGSASPRLARVHTQGVQKARQTPSASNDDLSTTNGPQFNPCTLVTVSEAQNITGGLIAGRVEAPLGPTCIYRLGHSKSDITLAVETLSFSQVTNRLAKREQVAVGTHRAYCGRLGTPMLFVPLAQGQLLHVSAPCAIAQRFAAFALSRLAA